VRILIAPQEFKGSLTAAEAARAIADGVRVALPDAETDEAPMSDGGAGLVDAMLTACGGERIVMEVLDPLMRPVRAGWALLPGGSAAIEMAAASGLVLLTAGERDPLITTTYGTGELIRAALDRGCRRILVGVGGSATVDAGAGAMQALGARMFNAAGADLPVGGAALARLARIDLTGVDARLAGAKIRVASDVLNTLCGPQGAAIIFGPQKGAAEQDARVLDAALARFAEIALRDTGIDLLAVPGSGAAGGLGAGLVVVAGATIASGFAIVAEAVGLDRRIAAADLVITGEGRLDAQTAYGKTAAGVAKMARAHGRRVGAIVGSVRADFDPVDSPFDAIVSAGGDGAAVEEAMRDAGPLVRAAAVRMMVAFGARDQSDRR
jgi:glycerate kinase